MKVAVIFHRLGPYHFARLNLAGKSMAVVAIETSGADETYAWDAIAGADGFERVTLFESADAQKQPVQEVVRRMIATLDKIRPQVVVIPGWSDSAALAALQWCGQNRVPAVIMSESTEWDEPRKAWKEFIKWQIIGRCAAALVGGSPHKDYLVKLGMPAERVFMGYDAVDNAYFAQGAKKQNLKPETLKPEILKTEVREQKSEAGRPSSLVPRPAGLPENYFLASARFIEKKNLPRLIEAYARYRELAARSTLDARRSTPWSLVLLGDGALRSSLEPQVSSLGLQHSVLLPGFIQYPELPTYYAHAGAFIHASTTEQWGLVVNEAMASGLPVLVSNRCGCAPDLVKEGVNGFTFDPYNVEQLAQLMFQVSAFQPFKLSEMGAASARLIAEWGPERFAQGLKDAAEKAMEVGPKRAGLVARVLLRALLVR